MTTPLQPKPLSSMTPISINYTLPTSNPSPKSILIGLACILGIIGLLVLYLNLHLT